jgi:septal ring factor EnvC (AmiA/AmiB activator)
MNPHVQELLKEMRATLEQTEAQVTEVKSQIYDLKQDLVDLERAIEGKPTEHPFGEDDPLA